MKQEQNAIRKGTFKEQENLSFENIIAKIKNYIVGVEDKDINQKVEQED